MTGNTISIGRSIDQADFGATMFYFTVVLCFVLGSAVGWSAQVIQIATAAAAAAAVAAAAATAATAATSTTTVVTAATLDLRFHPHLRLFFVSTRLPSGEDAVASVGWRR